jgi:hypothetical protein
MTFMSEYRKVSEYLNRLKSFGVTRADFRRTRNVLAHRSGEDQSPEEAYWIILNNLTRMIGDDPNLASQLFFFVGDHLLATGKNPKAAISEAQRWVLRGLLEEGVWRTIIRNVDDDQVCPGCRSLNLAVFKTVDALKVLPIPSKCTSAYCRCSYHDPHDVNYHSRQLVGSVLK